VKETEKGYEVAIDLPGFKKEDVTCELKDGYLTVSAEKKLEENEKDDNGRYIRRERYTGSQSRSFYIGEGIHEDDIHASFQDGILRLEVPKQEVQQLEDKRHFVQIGD
jgi:HSP20 family molecular chaperone IbpA